MDSFCCLFRFNTYCLIKLGRQHDYGFLKVVTEIPNRSRCVEAYLLFEAVHMYYIISFFIKDSILYVD